MCGRQTTTLSQQSKYFAKYFLYIIITYRNPFCQSVLKNFDRRIFYNGEKRKNKTNL